MQTATQAQATFTRYELITLICALGARSADVLESSHRNFKAWQHAEAGTPETAMLHQIYRDSCQYFSELERLIDKIETMIDGGNYA